MYINPKNTQKSFDYITFLVLLFLASCGLLFIFSSTHTADKPFSIFFIKQCIGVIGGIVIYFLCLIPDYRNLMRWGYFAYFSVLALLLFTSAKGIIGMGAKRWVNVLFFRLQPSELTKVFFPACMTNYLHMQKKTVLFSYSIFLPILATLAFSFLLILKQPDLGTALIVLFSALTLCWLAGLNKKFFLYGLLTCIIMTPALWTFTLHDYQKNRILVFLGYGDEKKERYQTEQASIAIGSGGIFGKGIFNGTQNRLRFLPESRTDFIFAVICEECGLVGALTIISCYIILFFRSFFIITKIKDFYAQLFASGVLLHIIIATIVNISMVIGILPVVGIPLPLISYGLSNLWITCACLGIFQNIAMHCRQ